MKLSDKAIVVTGGAQGLGRACAERFIADGGRLVLNYTVPIDEGQNN